MCADPAEITKIRVLYKPSMQRGFLANLKLAAWLAGAMALHWTMSVAIEGGDMPPLGEAEVVAAYMRGKVEQPIIRKVDALFASGIQLRNRDLRGQDEAAKRAATEAKKQNKDECKNLPKTEDKLRDEEDDDPGDGTESLMDRRAKLIAREQKEQEKAMKEAARARELQHLDVWDKDNVGQPSTTATRRVSQPPPRLQVEPGSPKPKASPRPRGKGPAPPGR